MRAFSYSFKQLRSVPWGLAGVAALVAGSACSTVGTVYTDQGKGWSESDRLQFYSGDQGSLLMPTKWLFALKQSNGQPFLADSLSRYGYLANPVSQPKGLPVGFTTHGDNVGMTCAACHTREIVVDDVPYRIDGGPAFADFQSFAADLDQAVGIVVNDSQAFDDFAKTVLGSTPTAADQARLRQDLEAWYKPFHTIMDRALPKDQPWGPVRLDAVGMIFNRLAGLDIGTNPDHIIESNIRKADAPVRYPFIWNAPIQDKTQWPGFAENGTPLLGLSRNLGEVYGVFADFHPQKAPGTVLGVDYLVHNSANFDGLKKLEKLVVKMQAPKWPWAVDSKLAAEGEAIFHSSTQTEAGGCYACHGERKGQTRSFQKTWATPLCDVGTDVKQFGLFKWDVDTGVLAGAKIPFLTQPLGEKALAADVLGLAVRATLLQLAKTPDVKNVELRAQTSIALAETLVGQAKTNKLKEITTALKAYQMKMLQGELPDLSGAFPNMEAAGQGSNVEQVQKLCKDVFTDPNPPIGYESRVLYGIWATAPYLHNGSVPTLADLLEPVEKRTPAFKVGPNYDPVKVGLDKDQSKFDYQLTTTGCDNLQSGNSRCGHEYGTKLSAHDKQALLEYLKIIKPES